MRPHIPVMIAEDERGFYVIWAAHITMLKRLSSKERRARKQHVLKKAWLSDTATWYT